jgi:hypothetical protein
MNLLNFVSQFPDEASCKASWKEYGDKEDVTCLRCGGTAHYWKSDKGCCECKHCKYRRSLRSNTVMHGRQLPFRYWFVAIHLLTSTKKCFSVSELQRQLGHSTYNPIWEMLHKLRLAMGKHDSKYSLKDVIEPDEGFLHKSIKEHCPQVISEKEVGKMLPWVHIAISNAGRMLPDLFHDIRPEYLQSYLNEFCYKFNRRYFGEKRFDRLMIVAVSYKNEFRCNIK